MRTLMGLLMSMLLVSGCSSLPKAQSPAAQIAKTDTVVRETRRALNKVEAGQKREEKMQKKASSISLRLHPEAEEKAQIEKFIKSHPVLTETDKIGYLLQAIQASRHTFFRNGRHYNGWMASRWFRRKTLHRKFLKNPLRGAEDFIDRVATRSNTTGLYYEVIFEDGTRARSREVLLNEVARLNHAIQAYRLMSALKQDARKADQASGPVPTSLLMQTQAAS